MVEFAKSFIGRNALAKYALCYVECVTFHSLSFLLLLFLSLDMKRLIVGLLATLIGVRRVTAKLRLSLSGSVT